MPRKTPKQMRATTVRGFTLLEMLITVAMVAILMAIATPSYNEYVRRSARADAQLVLQQAANHLERIYAECNSYVLRDASTVPPCNTSVNANDALPLELTRAPLDGTQRYTIAVEQLAAQAYTLNAAPLDATDPCGTFSMQSNGTRTVTGTLGADACWRR